MIAANLETVAEWLFYAKSDLEAAEALMKFPDCYHLVAYHSQQAIEKYIKAKLLEAGVDFPYIHNLLILAAKLPTPPPTTLLKELSYVNDLMQQSRYPQGDKISEAEAAKALNIASDYLKLV